MAFRFKFETLLDVRKMQENMANITGQMDPELKAALAASVLPADKNSLKPGFTTMDQGDGTLVPVPAYTKGMDVREIVEMVWMPRLEAFKPEMIFVSAGFDAHRDDDMGQLGLTEQDYAWITMRIKDVARRFSNKRIVSCLEGGYVMGPLARSVEAHVRVLADL